MTQALHIFRKDVGYLRSHIALTLLAAAAFCLMGMSSSRGPGPTTFILPVTWLFLIAAVIHAEPLPGKGHFWLTRPYDRKSLVGAKVLFIFSFVNVPLMIADLAIIHAAGFSIAAKFGGLIWTQVLLVAVFELPAAAVASITSGLLDLLIVSLFLILAALVWLFIAPMAHWGFGWTEVGWIRDYCLYAEAAAIAAMILLCQYTHRITFAMRILAAFTPVLLLASSTLFPWTAAFALQIHFSKQNVDLSSVRIQQDSARKWSGGVYVTEQDDVTADIPIQVAGLPTGIDLTPNGATVKLRASNGETWTVDEAPPHSFDFDSGAMSLRATMTKTFYESVKNQPLRLSGTLYGSLSKRQRTASLPVNSGRIYVEGVGICAAGTRFLLCNSAFRPQRGFVNIQVIQELANGRVQTRERLSGAVSYSPFPADFNVDPLFQLFSPRLRQISAASIEASELIGYLGKNFDIDNVFLRDFKFRTDEARDSATLPSCGN